MSTLTTGHVPDPLWRRIIGPPGTHDGRVSVWMTGGAMGVLALVGGLAAAGLPDRGWGAQLAIGLPGFLAFLAAVVAGGVATRSIFHGERSIVIVAPLLFGSVALFIVLGEVLLPH